MSDGYTTELNLLVASGELVATGEAERIGGLPWRDLLREPLVVARQDGKRRWWFVRASVERYREMVTDGAAANEAASLSNEKAAAIGRAYVVWRLASLEKLRVVSDPMAAERDRKLAAVRCDNAHKALAEASA